MISLDDIARAVHVTAGIAKKYLTVLINKRLITNKYFLSPDFQRSNDGKFFTLPNEIFLLQLSPSAFMAYAYLLLIEDRKTHTCHPSYNTIATETGMAKNTALKSVSILLEVGLIAVEASSYFDKHGMKWKGNNLYTILPLQSAVDIFYQRQFYQLELATEQTRIRRWQESYTHSSPTEAV